MSRQILEVTGSDAEKFLGDLVTNIVPSDGGIAYNALLSPQGKYLFDFFVLKLDDALWIDVKKERAQALGQRLMMYRLRADVALKALDVNVAVGTGDAPKTAFADPRNAGLGWRDYDGAASESVDWDALRVEHVVPETDVELQSDDSYILEMGFERLNGVDFKKGCYVGQEVTARMKHKTELRKGLGRVRLNGTVAPGDEITSTGKVVGKVHTVSGDRALAYLRFDRASGEMTIGEASAELDWAP